MYRPNGAVDWINFGEGFNTVKALTLQLSNFANAVSEGESLEINAAAELESVRAIEIAYQSLRTGQRLELRPAPPACRQRPGPVFQPGQEPGSPAP